jgi:4-alpha-glucanotransferase
VIRRVVSFSNEAGDMTDESRLWGVEDGYHDVFGNWHQADVRTTSLLTNALSAASKDPAYLHAPVRGTLHAYQGGGERRWGVSVQLYSVQSTRNWGIGDFTDLLAIVELAAKSGADAVGLNPLHALFLDRPENASPYAPNSRVFLNPLYIDVMALSESSGIVDTALAEAIENVRASELVDYAGVADLKEQALRRAYERFVADGTQSRQAAFAAYRAARGERLVRFACFEVLRRRFQQTSWRQWPDPWRCPDQASITGLRTQEDRECGFFEYLQWIAEEQLATCQARAHQLGLGIGLYLDLAVGVDPDGADAWSNQTSFLSEFSVGAPPDEFNPAGQDWGLAPLNPHVLADNDFFVIRELLAAVMRYAGAVRLDHVLGLKRMYLVPHGASPAQGVYVRYPFEPLLSVIAEESNRFRCVFIGEDLGTVPADFREITGRWGIWTYRVMIFERFNDGEFKPPHEYPSAALATFNTHDLPTFRAWMTGHDLRSKRAIGIDPGESEESRQHAREALQRAVSQVERHVPPDSFGGVASYLAATPAQLVMVSAEDMLDFVEQVNIPGTTTEHPNWRHKLPLDVQRWGEDETWASVASAFARAGRNPPR